MSSSECTARPRENPQTVGLLLGGPRGGGWHRVVFLIKLTSRFRGSMATIPTVGALDGHLEGCQRHLFPLKPTRKSNTTSHGSDLRGDTAATRGDSGRCRRWPSGPSFLSLHVFIQVKHLDSGFGSQKSLSPFVRSCAIVFGL